MKNTLILVFNCGSSSLKFSILNPNTKKIFLRGIVDCINSNNIFIKWFIYGIKFKLSLFGKISYKEILNNILKNILFKERYLLSKIVGIGHRVVHGGKYINKSVIINKKILHLINKACIFSPLHNPINLLCIKIILKKISLLKYYNVAVFDTSFYKNLSKESYLYAIPYLFYKKYGIRKYGAHGISYIYVLNEVSNLLNISKNKLNIIACHLGNGSSISVIQNGICIDTSMGLTPLEGLIMGTRSGDIDPSIIFYMYNKLKINILDIEKILTKKSGLLGINNFSSDFRKIQKSYYTNKFSKLSINMFCRRIIKYIGSYFVLIKNKFHALVFTGGIGENVSLVRKIIISKLSKLGFFINLNKNNNINNKNNCFINTKKSFNILVIPTNEEFIIAKETNNLVYKNLKI